ncbi:MAG: hypothetical protein O7H39_03510 [Gammaproteobacteria bacterium]|nr:hypothetical protein [Gammaproteobacteria bacterium]
MADLAVGQRLKSTSCTTEIMVIAAPGGDIDLMCGGALMGGEDDNGATVHPDFAEGSALGKRYINDDGDLELLCVKAGEGSLSVGESALTIKGATKRPKTD